MRSHYLFSYDISDPKRWRRVYRIARDFGDHLQYSVFLCELGDKDKAVMEDRLREAISKDEDQVLMVQLRGGDMSDLIECWGRPTEVVDRKVLIY